AAILLSLPLLALAVRGVEDWWLALLALLGLIPSIDAAMALVNRSVTRELGATILPGLELRDGVPSHLRTMVAVPILLTTQAALEGQIERLEIHHLASPEGELYFALLSDWTDAATETVAGDNALLEAAAAGIARRLVGKMAHPLNHPRFDPGTRRVVEGYGVLQPRVTPSLPIGREGSLFQRIFSSTSGIDPYASAVSDVYQDLFGEGSYAGKGIYDVDAFEAALDGRVRENTLLSHDLFEGTFARAGLASD